jgi:hypothetical protein
MIGGGLSSKEPGQQGGTFSPFPNLPWGTLDLNFPSTDGLVAMACFVKPNRITT